MLEKRQIIESATAVARYRKLFDYCEACAKLNGDYPVRSQLELHHIFGGSSRTDEVWNFIMLCNLHHQMGTTHNLKYGSEAKEWNRQYLAIKYLKGESDFERLESLGLRAESIDGLAKVIKGSYPYVTGIRLGWFEK